MKKLPLVRETVYLMPVDDVATAAIAGGNGNNGAAVILPDTYACCPISLDCFPGPGGGGGAPPTDPLPLPTQQQN